MIRQRSSAAEELTNRLCAVRILIFNRSSQFRISLVLTFGNKNGIVTKPASASELLGNLALYAGLNHLFLAKRIVSDEGAQMQPPGGSPIEFASSSAAWRRFQRPRPCRRHNGPSEFREVRLSLRLPARCHRPRPIRPGRTARSDLALMRAFSTKVFPVSAGG